MEMTGEVGTSEWAAALMTCCARAKCGSNVWLTVCHEDDSIVGYEGTCQKCGHSMTLAFEKEK